jgi:hypothetical protein
VRTIATRYKGRIGAYEIWNEPNLPMFFSGSIPKMVELTKVANQEIRKIDPSAIIVSPSTTNMERGFKWTLSYLNAGGAALVDVIGFHLYDDNKAPEAMIPKVDSFLKMLRDGGYAGKPLWNTETGLLNNNLLAAPGVVWNATWKNQRIEPDQAADYLVRAFLIARSLGFERYYWYAWDNRWLGMIEPGNLSPKAPAEAYGKAYAYLLHSTFQRCDRDTQGRWTCLLTMANGAPAQALWMDPSAGQQQMSVLSPFTGEVISFNGNSSQTILANTKISIDSSVKMIVQDK